MRRGHLSAKGKKTMRRALSGTLLRSIAIFSLISALLSAAGCDTAPAPKPAATGAKPVVGIFLYKKSDAYISLVGKALEGELAGRADLVVEYAEEDQITQNRQIETLIEKKPSVLVVNLVNTQGAADILDKAKKAGIPVIFFNREPDPTVFAGYEKVAFVGTYAADAGKMQGDIIKKLWDTHPEYDRNKDGKLQYAMFQGNSDNPEAVARTEHSVKRARELGVAMSQVGETHVCDWDEALAKQAMQMALAAHPDTFELILANNDSMALGAIAALAEQGWNTEGGAAARFIPVVGVDALPRAVEAVQKGVMSATVKQDDKAMGKAIAALTVNAVNGKPFLEGTPYSWDASGLAVRIPYSLYTGGK